MKKNYNIASYFRSMKLSRKKSPSNNLTLSNRFLAEIIKIIFKNLKCVLLIIFSRIYFCFNLTANFWL